MRLGGKTSNNRLSLKLAPVLMAAVLLGFICFPAQSDDEIGTSFADLLDELTVSDFQSKTDAVHLLEQSGDPRAPAVLQAMLDGRLYYHKEDKTIVIVERVESGFHLTDVLTESDLGTAGRRDVKKISVNNRLRGAIRSAIARLSLTNPDAKLRLAAVEQMFRDATPETSALLREMLEREKDKRVIDAIRAVVALTELESENVDTRLSAIETLRGNLETEVRIKLVALTGLDAEGNYVEVNGIVREAALEVLRGIDRRIMFYGSLETVFFRHQPGFHPRTSRHRFGDHIRRYGSH